MHKTKLIQYESVRLPAGELATQYHAAAPHVTERGGKEENKANTKPHGLG